MNKKILGFIILFLLMVNILSYSGIAQTDYFFIISSTDFYDFYDHPIYGGYTTENMAVDIDGNYYIATFNETSPYQFQMLRSLDNGDTWHNFSLGLDMSDENDKKPLMIASCIDDSEIIHIAYCYDDGSKWNISYFKYNTNTNTTTAKTSIRSSGTSTDYYYGLCINVNDGGEVAIAWTETTSSFNNATVRIRVYNDQAEVWGDVDIISYDVTAGDLLYMGLKGDVLSNNTFVYSYMRYLSSPDSKLRVAYYNPYTFAHKNYFSEGCISNSFERDNCDIAVDSNDDLHIIYESGNGVISYCKYWTGNDTESTHETIISDNAYYPSIAINSDDTVQLVFEFDNGVSPSDWIGGVYGDYGSWSDLQYYVSGATDNMQTPIVPYQNLQSFTHLTDGVIGYYNNITDNNFIHFDEGYELFYGGTGGQDSGDLTQYDLRCSDAMLYEEQIYKRYLENYIENFGDITVKGFELYVTDNQIDVVSGLTSSYEGYLNGVFMGNPDYIFQVSAGRYKLQWTGLNINVGTNDLIYEFKVNTVGALGYFWYVPMAFIDTAKTHSNASLYGNGYHDGTVYSGGLGLGTCTYYDINVPTESDNTYSLNLMSTDPHYKGNATSFSITVTGNAPWIFLIKDPNGNTVASDIRDYGENIFYFEYIVKESWITGEYVIYALDWDAYPTGLSVADNITFNVTAYAGTGEWDIKATIDPIVVGTYQSLSYVAKSGHPYAILWMYHPTSESGYIRQGVGDGQLHTIDLAFLVDRDGTWSVSIQNRTSSDTTEWTTYRDTFQAVGQITNFIEIGEQGDYICNTGYATVNGFYDGSSGTLWFYKNNNTFKTYALPKGGFTIKFYPDDTESDLGVYKIYITNIDQEILEWSRGLTIEVYDCTDVVPIDPDFVPMYKGNVVMGGILSFIIIVVLMLLPYGFTMGLSKKGQTVSIPALIPIGFGCTGFIMSCVLQFIDPMYLVAFLVLVVIFAFFFGYTKIVGKGGES